MTIQFPYPGGKARIRETLFEHFPEEGHAYIEPFAGRGNVFFEFYKRSDFKHYILNDIKLSKFFYSLRSVDLTKLPDSVDEFNFEVWQNRWLAGDMVAHVIEPKITFRGKGYMAGYQKGRYNKQRYSHLCAQAQSILLDARVRVRGGDYIHLEWDKFGSENFVYCDPPYYETDGVGYNNIKHEELLALLTDAKFQWAISGYMSELYLAWLGEPVLKIERGHEMSGDRGATTVECLWSNR